MSGCKECGRELSAIDIALTKKLINRGCEDFLCIDCLAEHFKVSREMLLEKAEQFKRQGCLLFADLL